MELVYIFKIVLFFLYLLCVYNIARRRYNDDKRFSATHIIVLSIVFGFLSYIYGSDYYNGLDRVRYYMHYLSGRDVSASQSVGLNSFFNFCRLLDLEAREMMAFFSCIYMMLMLFAYNKYKDADPTSLLFLLFSNYVVFGFAQMKQSLSQSLISLAFILYFNNIGSSNVNKVNNKFSVYILIGLLLYGGCSFHASGYFFVLVFLMLVFWKYTVIRNVSYVMIIVALLIFDIIMRLYFIDVISYSETIQEQFGGYEGKTLQSSMLTIFKSSPFYIVTILAFYHRSALKSFIDNYDRYLLICYMCSVFGLLCIYNYWYFRFSLFLYFPFFVFMSLIRKVMIRNNMRTFYIDLSFVILVLLDVKQMFQYFFNYGGF